MGDITYGCVTGVADSTAKEYPVAAGQYFYHTGINFVDITSGYVTKAETADTALYGFVIVPKGRGDGTDDSYFYSGTTAGKYKFLVVTDLSALFLLPSDAAPAITDNGKLCDIIAANDSNGTAEYIDIGTSTTDVIQIVDYDGTKYGGATNSVLCRINPLKYQGV